MEITLPTTPDIITTVKGRSHLSKEMVILLIILLIAILDILNLLSIILPPLKGIL
jgi:hypothetical protein